MRCVLTLKTKPSAASCIAEPGDRIDYPAMGIMRVCSFFLPGSSIADSTKISEPTGHLQTEGEVYALRNSRLRFPTRYKAREGHQQRELIACSGVIKLLRKDTVNAMVAYSLQVNT